MNKKIRQVIFTPKQTTVLPKDIINSTKTHKSFFRSNDSRNRKIAISTNDTHDKNIDGSRYNSEDDTIEAIEQSAVPGHNMSGILDAYRTFE